MDYKDMANDIMGTINSTMDLFSGLNVPDTIIPEDQNMVFSGIKDMKALNMLFSGNLDTLISKMLDSVSSGKFDSVLQSLESLGVALDKNGVTSDSTPFTGKVTTGLVNVIKNSVNSRKYNNMSSKFRKVLLISKNLNKYVRTIRDPHERKKYEDALYTINKLVKFINKLYKSRKMVSDRFLKGFSTLMTEEQSVVHIDMMGW